MDRWSKDAGRYLQHYIRLDARLLLGFEGEVEPLVLQSMAVKRNLLLLSNSTLHPTGEAEDPSCR